MEVLFSHFSPVFLIPSDPHCTTNTNSKPDGRPHFRLERCHSWHISNCYIITAVVSPRPAALHTLLFEFARHYHSLTLSVIHSTFVDTCVEITSVCALLIFFVIHALYFDCVKVYGNLQPIYIYTYISRYIQVSGQAVHPCWLMVLKNLHTSLRCWLFFHLRHLIDRELCDALFVMRLW